jgi:hypothetical protein
MQLQGGSVHIDEVGPILIGGDTGSVTQKDMSEARQEETGGQVIIQETYIPPREK